MGQQMKSNRNGSRDASLVALLLLRNGVFPIATDVFPSFG